MTEQDRIEAQRRHDAGERWADIAGSEAGGRRLRKSMGKWRKRRAARGCAAPSTGVVDAPCEGVRVVSATHAATVDEVAQANGLDLARWRCVKVQGKPYQGYMRGDDGEPVIVNLWSRSFTFERIPDALALDLPACPEYPEPAPPPPADADACCLIIPDSQNGYRRDTFGRLEPLHDRRAWDLAVQAAEVVKPDTIVMLGDMLDLAPWSCRWPTPLNLRDTTNPARAELRWWIRQLREAAPSARIVWLEGNHEDRIARLMTERAGEMGGLIDLDTGEQMVTIPRIMQMDGLRVEYVAPYGTPWWLWRESPDAAVMFHHGHTHGAKGGQSVAKALVNDPVSSVFGHVHRREMAARVLPDHRSPQGRRECFALTPATIARVDGAVPAASPRVDWHQGLGILRRVGGVAFESLVPIKGGRAVVEGRALTARDRLPEIRAAYPDWRW